MASALQFYFNVNESDNSYDNETRLIDLLEDLYTVETATGSAMKISTKSIQISGDKTTTSTSYVDVSGTAFNHTFTYPNAEIEIVARLANSGNANSFLRPMVNSSAGLDSTEARVRNMTEVIKASDRFESIATGTPIEVKAQFRVSAGTATVFQDYNVVVVIREYE